MSLTGQHVLFLPEQSDSVSSQAGQAESGESDVPQPQKSGKGIRWHEGENFLHEFDDTHLWLHGN